MPSQPPHEKIKPLHHPEYCHKAPVCEKSAKAPPLHFQHWKYGSKDFHPSGNKAQIKKHGD
jgi:hypothetical protein